MTELNPWRPERLLDVRAVFGIDSDLQVPAFAERDEHVPEIDAVYRFDRDTTLARLAGLMRKRLVVVSDGCPMDGATNLANDAFCLDNHLKQVLQRHERAGHVEICALGLGLDLSPFYSRCQALDLGTTAGPALLRDILQLLARPARR